MRFARTVYGAALVVLVLCPAGVAHAQRMKVGYWTSGFSLGFGAVMEQMTNGKSLEEVQAVAPILQRIASDTSVINVTRARARRLLAENTTAGAH